MIMGKRQIVLASLILVLGVAIYLNWQFAENDLTAQPVNQTQDSSTGEPGKNYGDAQLVNAGGTSEELQGDDLFSTTKFNRKKTREEAVEQAKKALNETGISDEEKTKAIESIQQISKATDQEVKMESLIQAKGFSECVVFYNNDKVDVVVRSGGLTASEAAQIKDIVLGEAKVPNENISILEVK